MFEVQVSMTDTYGNAYFITDVERLDVSSVEKAIMDKFACWSKQLSGIGAGCVRVTHGSTSVAKGTIMWLFVGGYSLRLESMLPDDYDGTSVCHEDYPRTEQTLPACCALV